MDFVIQRFFAMKNYGLNYFAKKYINTTSLNNKLPKLFSSIPGPMSVPFFGSLWKYLPFIGNYDLNHLDKTSAKKLKEFGSVVKEEVAKGVFLVSVFDAEDIATVYKSEGRYPQRRSHLALEQYRCSRLDIYNNGGLLPTNGIEWWKLRSAFQKSLSRIQDVRLFLPIADHITAEFLNEAIQPGAVIEDALSLVSRLNLELTWYAIFGERLFSYDITQMDYDSIPSKLIRAAETVNNSILGTDNTEVFWKKFKTPLYRKLESNLNFIEKIAIKAIKKKQNELNNPKLDMSGKSSLLEKFLNCPEVDIKDVLGVCIDLLLGGVDTTSYTTCFILYHLGTNPDVQTKLQQESRALLSTNNSPVTNITLNNASYTRAVLKETFRLNPISIGVSRILGEDAVLGGYFVPQGTLILIQNQVACRLEKNFTNPHEFIPERWLRKSPLFTSVSPFLVLPFSHGPRTCIARRLAEQNLLTLIMKIMRKFNIIYLGEKLDIVTPLINKPDKPVQTMFTKIR